MLINSCATLTKEDCSKINWKQKGHDDSSTGEEASKFSDYQRKCSEHGISISQPDYVEGYKLGLKSYCNYQKGYARGENGDEPFKACDSVSSNFNRGYEKGFSQYEADQEEIRKKKVKQEAIESIVRRYGSEECSSDSDCRKSGDCNFNKCEHDNSECTFNSDCKVEGDCKSESDYVSSIGEWVEARVCDY